MAYQLKTSRVIALSLFLIFLAFPVYAHKTEVSGSVAGTWHIEPNHNPKAGESAQVWVALTRQGGEIIPLEQCNCQLKIWAVPKGAMPLLEPSLKPLSAEQYRGIPSAEIVFPRLGQYELELSGTPKAGADFQPFQFNHTILVAAGTASPTASPSPQTTESQVDTAAEESNPYIPRSTQPVPQRLPVIVLAIVIATGVLGLIGWRLKLGKRSRH